ncbi:MAG: hypothetical protein HY908_24295 [Myxococcales bacterium]|nr:hypothetical protein [Myxococcales bacterium]
MHPPGIDGAVDDALRKVGSGHVWISGPEGSGRATVGHVLAERVAGSVFLDLPALDSIDLPAAMMIVAAGAVGGAGPLADGAGHASVELRDAIAGHRGTWIVRLCGRLAPAVPTSADADHARRRVLDAISMLSRASHVVWIADPTLDPREVGLAHAQRVTLPPFAVDLEPSRYASLAAAAKALRDAVGAGVRRTPVEWRLAVGAVALGATGPDVGAIVHGSSSSALGSLAMLLGDAIRRNASLAQAVRRMLLARQPVAADDLLSIAVPPGGTEHILTTCIGYGNPVRVSATVARVLSSRVAPLAAAEVEVSHAALAQVRARADGASDPRGLSAERARAWVEKVHHLAEAGDRGAGEWSLQVKPCPEMYWERARHYSIERRQYAKAADVYAACLAAFPNDDYAHHYLAFNAKKARRAASLVTEHFRRAVESAPDNPWWNARRISDLIEQRDWIGAKRELRAALDRVDPDGSRAATDPWLVAHFHYWIAQAWMDAGVWYEARSLLTPIPPSVIAEAATARPGSRGLRALERAIARAESTERRAFQSWLAPRRGAWSRLGAVWRALDERIPGLPVPAASEGEDGPSLVWSHPGLLLELEPLGSQGVTWRARDRVTAEHGEASLAKPVPSDALRAWALRARHG